MFRRSFLVLLALVVAGLGPRGGAEQPPARVRYDNHVVVRAYLTSQRDLQTMLSISPDPWTDSVGIGPMDFRVSPQDLKALEASGIRYEILIDNVQVLIDAEWQRLARGGVAGASWFDDYKDYAAVNAYLNDLVALRPDLAELLTIGASIEGRTIYGLRITGPGQDKPAVVLNGCQHAREWIAVMVPMYIADRLIRDYDTDPVVADLVDRVEFFIIPIVNPDGYQYSWDVDRLWRKNRRDNGGGTFGVDINRNWEYEWGGDGSSSNPGSQIYRGTAPFSEPETAAVRDFYLANPQIVSNIDFHSYSQLVLQPWGYTVELPPDHTLLDELGAVMASDMTSVHGMTYINGPAGIILYLASGISIDWTYGDQGVFSYTFELRDTGQTGFILPPEQIIPNSEEVFPAVLDLADFSTQGVLFSFPFGLPDLVEADTETAILVDITPIAGGSLEPGTAKLYARIGAAGPFVESDLMPLGGSSFEGVLPAAPCGSVVQFYFQVQTTDGVVHRSPDDAPATLYEALAAQVEFEDDFETDTGWTVGAPGDDATTGVWVRVDPNGTAAQPEDDHTPDPATLCFVTGQGSPGGPLGENDVDGGKTTLTSPLIDLSDAGDAFISYWRWYSNDTGASPNADVFVVDISNNNGSSWTNVETVGPSGPETSGGWFYHEFVVTDFVTPSAQMRMRFIASDEGSGSIVEAAVDDFAIGRLLCEPSCPADLDGDGTIGPADLAMLLTCWGTPCGDLNNDGSTDPSDLAILLANWGPCP